VLVIIGIAIVIFVMIIKLKYSAREIDFIIEFANLESNVVWLFAII
jgi:hypothetical protein